MTIFNSEILTLFQIKKHILEKFHTLYSDKIRNPERLWNIAFPKHVEIVKFDLKSPTKTEIKKRDMLELKSWNRVVIDFSHTSIKKKRNSIG
jgi:hypothetical protein